MKSKFTSTIKSNADMNRTKTISFTFSFFAFYVFNFVVVLCIISKIMLLFFAVCNLSFQLLLFNKNDDLVKKKEKKKRVTESTSQPQDLRECYHCTEQIS